MEKGRWNLKIAIVTTEKDGKNEIFYRKVQNVRRKEQFDKAGSWIPFCRVEFRLERNTEK